MNRNTRYWAVVLFVLADTPHPSNHKFLQLVRDGGARTLPCSDITADVTGNEGYSSITWAESIIPGIGEFLGYTLPIPVVPTYDFTQANGDIDYSVAVFLFELQEATPSSSKFVVEEMSISVRQKIDEASEERCELVRSVARDYYVHQRHKELSVLPQENKLYKPRRSA